MDSLVSDSQSFLIVDSPPGSDGARPSDSMRHGRHFVYSPHPNPGPVAGGDSRGLAVIGPAGGSVFFGPFLTRQS